MASNNASATPKKNSPKKNGSPTKNEGASGGAASSEGKRYESQRKKIKTVPFELDDTPAVRRKSAGAASTTEQKVLLYVRNDFLAVRNDTDGFFLCRAHQHVYDTTKSFSIQWLEEDAGAKGTYDAAFLDSIELQCVLVEVKLQRINKDRFTLPPTQLDKVNESLAEVLEGGGKKGKSVGKRGKGGKKAAEEESEEEEEEEEEEADEPKSKRAKLNKKVASPAPKTKAAKAKAGKSSAAKASTSEAEDSPGKKKKEPKKRAAAANGAEKKATPEKARKGQKNVLVPQPNIKVWEQDPLVATGEAMPFISTLAHSKLLFRAVHRGDNKLLQQLIDDRKHIAKVDIAHSVTLFWSPMHIALKSNNQTAVRLLSKEMYNYTFDGKGPRVAVTTSILERQSTGTYNRLSLRGLGNVRKVAMSRGSREGNNAFVKDCQHGTYNWSLEKYIEFALRTGVSKQTLDVFIMATGQEGKRENVQQMVYDRIHVAVSNGHRKLAAELMEEQTKAGVNQFAYLHRPVLMYDKEDLPVGIRAASVSKKPWDNKKITPLHCAAINPNPKYLSKLLTILPEYSIVDASQRRPIHFAAACEGTGPLELLINRGMDTEATDSTGVTPLMIACMTGRAHNVELLLSRAKAAHEEAEAKAAAPKVKAGKGRGGAAEDDEGEDEAPVVSKYGVGGINRPIAKPQNKFCGYCPLHLAAHYAHTEVLEVLLRHKADVERELGATKDKLSALMVAASSGDLTNVRLLVREGSANILHRDKLKRTVLCHAAKNGHAHIVSFLLSEGLDPNLADTSGNTALHYAVGYGWYFVTKVLLEAGANASAPNEWKSTPLTVAFMKGHMGLADLLLEQPSVDINFRLDTGTTLVSVACSSQLVDDIVSQLEYLVVKKKADCTLVNAENENALHHLARNRVYGYPRDLVAEASAKAKSVEMARLLVDHGCDPGAMDSSGLTPVMYAVQAGNEALVRFLVDQNGGVLDTRDAEGDNILHYMAELCMTHALADVLTLIRDAAKDRVVFTDMAHHVDHRGFTPLMLACFKYMSWDGKVEESASPYEADSDEEEEEDDDDDDDADGSADGKEDGGEGDQAQGGEGGEDDPLLQMDVVDGDTDDEDEGGSDGGARPKKATPPKDKHSPTAKGSSAGKGGNRKQDEKAQRALAQWKAGRKFIELLFNICPAIADMPLQKIHFKKTDKIPIKEREQYFKEEYAGFSVIHFLINVPNEIYRLRDAHNGDAPGSSKAGPEESVASHPSGNWCLALSKMLDRLKKTPGGGRVPTEHYNVAGETPLVLAIKGHHTTAARKLMEFGVNVNSKSQDKDADGLCSPLVLSAQLELHTLIPSLLMHGACAGDTDCRTLQTALHAVLQRPGSSFSLKSTVAELLGAKASVTAVDKDLRTPLHVLVEHSRDTTDVIEVTNALLKAGAPINAADKLGRTPLHLSVNANQGGANSSTVLEQFLLDAGADAFARDVRQRLPLHYVFVKIGHHMDTSALDPVELCSTLISSSEKARTMVNHEDEFGLTPLHVAARRGAGVCCMFLIQKGASVNGRNYEGNTPLSLAIANGHESCTILLLQRSADIGVNIVKVPPPKSPKPDEDEDKDDVDAEGKKRKKKKPKPAWLWKPLRDVEKPAHTETYSLFQGVVLRDWQGITFMMLDLLESFKLTLGSVIEAALVTQKYNLALTLIRKVRSNTDLHGRVENGLTLAHVLARCSKAEGGAGELVTSVAQMLHDRGVRFELTDDFGCTPLHYACLQGSRPLIVFILGCSKASLEKKDKQGRTALAAAFWKLGQNGSLVLRIAGILRERGAQLDVLCAYPNQQVLHYGYRLQRRSTDDDDYSRPSGAQCPPVSPLMLAVYHQDCALTRELIRLGADVNFSDADGRSPLMLAVSENAVHIVRLLLDHSYIIDDNDNDSDDDTPPLGALAVHPATLLKKKPSQRRFGLALQRKGSLQRGASNETAAAATSSGIAASKRINGLNMSYKTRPKTSDVNVRALDNRRRSALHYLVRSFPNGSFDNYRLLQQLVAVGTPLEQPDSDGQTVLDYALAHGLPRLSTAIQYLISKDRTAYSRPTTSGARAHDDISWGSVPVPDYKADAAVYLEKFEAEWAEEEGKAELDYKVEPDPNLSSATTGQVLVDTDLDMPYDVLLFKIDVSAGSWGLYNFYKMQLIHQKGKDLYVLFTRWGRIGSQGQFQQTPFAQLEDAVKEFRKVFRQKTTNDWLKSKSFEHKPGKYRLVPLEERRFGKQIKDIKLNLDASTLKSKLHPYVQDLIKELTDVTAISRAMAQIGVDESVIPLNRLKKETLVKARDILAELGVLVKSVAKIRATMPIADVDTYKSELEKIAGLTNEYYHLVPRSSCEYERIPILDEEDLLKNEWKNVDMLLELELGAKMMVGAQYRINEMNPLDYIYRCLRCEIQLMDEHDTVAQYILRYVSATFTGKVEAIYCVTREGEDKRLEGCGVDNHRLLFHGSSSSNLISILSRGLLIAPPEAPVAGYLFGKGVYTADRFEKSLGYCHNYGRNAKTKFMLICEVALGHIKELHTYTAQPIEATETFDSVLALGKQRPDPQFDVTLPTGAVIPLGANKTFKPPQGVHAWAQLGQSEFIVYREEQVCLRYIIQFRDD